MGTNFYFGKREQIHIGKRSAAGWYCWDCGVTLCKGGEAGIGYDKYEWYRACPQCGKKPEKEDWISGATGRELGFNTSLPAPKKGVASCASFSWAIHPDDFAKSKRCVIYDEYGRKFTRAEFTAILSECPIQHTRLVGQWFS